MGFISPEEFRVKVVSEWMSSVTSILHELRYLLGI